jgi:hypothetical protein
VTAFCPLSVDGHPDCSSSATLICIWTHKSIFTPFTVARHCHHTVLMVFSKLCTFCTFQPQKSNHCILLLSGACKVDTNSGERQLNGECQISHYNNNREVLWLQFHAHSAVGSVTQKMTILQILFDLTSYIHDCCG